MDECTVLLMVEQSQESLFLCFVYWLFYWETISEDEMIDFGDFPLV